MRLGPSKSGRGVGLAGSQRGRGHGSGGIARVELISPERFMRCMVRAAGERVYTAFILTGTKKEDVKAVTETFFSPKWEFVALYVVKRWCNLSVSSRTLGEGASRILNVPKSC